jgi:hypothetical protein
LPPKYRSQENRPLNSWEDKMSVTTAPLPLAGPAAAAPAHGRSAGRWILRALSTTVTVLVSIVAVLAIVLAVATRTSVNGQFAAFGHPVMSMLSGSMTGVINTGDLIVDDPVTPAQAQHLSTILGTSTAYGTIEIEINHG